jgi:hypothetical protein
MELRINSFSELHEALAKYRNDFSWIFRGHSRPDWKLLPKVARNKILARSEESIFLSWRRRAVEYVSTNPPTTWDWLAIAQHHGLATRLLDWSLNPLIATFFAVKESYEGDAIIYAFKPKKIVFAEKVEPLNYKGGVAHYRPSAFANRISRQGATFTVHGPNSTEASAENGHIDKLIIDQNYRGQLQQELSHYGYNHSTIFPDLDGLSEFLNWIFVTRQPAAQSLAASSVNELTPIANKK